MLQETHAVHMTDLVSPQINCQTLFFFSCLCFQIFRDINIEKVDFALHVQHRHCPDKQGIFNNRMKMGIMSPEFSQLYESVVLWKIHANKQSYIAYYKKFCYVKGFWQLKSAPPNLCCVIWDISQFSISRSSLSTAIASVFTSLRVFCKVCSTHSSPQTLQAACILWK